MKTMSRKLEAILKVGSLDVVHNQWRFTPNDRRGFSYKTSPSDVSLPDFITEVYDMCRVFCPDFVPIIDLAEYEAE